MEREKLKERRFKGREGIIGRTKGGVDKQSLSKLSLVEL